MLSDPGRLQLLVLERRDPAQNMARFYVLSLEPTLFGDDVALVREWGRLGRQGHRRLDLYANPMVAAEALETWSERKVRRGFTTRITSGGPTEGEVAAPGRPHVRD